VNVLVTIPVYNEEKRLRKAIATLILHLESHPEYQYQILIANNGSTDQTADMARCLARTHSSVVVRNFDLKGRGGALQTVWSQSTADIFTYMDADLSTGLEAFPRMIALLASGKADIAIGTRLHPDSNIKRCFRREIISRLYNYLVRTVFSTNVSDFQCGFKGLTKETAMRLLPFLKDHEFFFDTEMLLVAESSGFRIAEIPIRWIENTDSSVRILRTAWIDVKGLIRVYRNLRAGKYSAVAGTPVAISGPSNMPNL
jgi:glycosyltransferase involved in cell wall biosynthesis